MGDNGKEEAEELTFVTSDNLEIISDTDDDSVDITDSDDDIKKVGVSVFPEQKMIPLFDENSDEKRLRKEWSQDEDKIFLQGLLKHKLDFGEIQKMIPHRSRSQIRTHYRYLARSLRANAVSTAIGGKKVRRLRNRGRPSRSKVEAKPSKLFLDLSKTIAELEQKFPSKQRGRPSKLQIGEVMQFNTQPPPVQTVPVLMVNHELRIPTEIIFNSIIPQQTTMNEILLQRQI